MKITTTWLLLFLPTLLSAMEENGFSGYTFYPYTTELYSDCISVTDGDYKTHPAFVKGNSASTLRWVIEELIGKYERIYSIRESIKSLPGYSRGRLLTINYSKRIGDPILRGIRLEARSAIHYKKIDGKRVMKKNYRYTIDSWYHAKSKLRAELKKWKKEGRIFHSIEEVVEALDSLGVIAKYYAAGQEKYEEYLSFMKSIEGQWQQVLKERQSRIIDEIIGLEAQGPVTKMLVNDPLKLLKWISKIIWQERNNVTRREYVTELMSFGRSELFQEVIYGGFGEHGQVVESHKHPGRFRFMLTEGQFERVFNTMKKQAALL